MIYLIYGQNSYQRQLELDKLVAEQSTRRIDGEGLSLADLQDLLLGLSLFDSSQLLIISDLSLMPDLWERLPDLLPQTDKTVILLELAVDKRTKVFKWLKQQATTIECPPLSDRQQSTVIRWLAERSKQRGLQLSVRQQQFIVDRLGVEQMTIDRLLEQLQLATSVDDRLIEALLPMDSRQNAFELFEAALGGERQKVQQIISYLEQSTGQQGAYATLGLMVAQLTSLYALVATAASSQVIAEQLKMHPYGLDKLRPFARRLDQPAVAAMIECLFRADRQAKTTAVSPWISLEAALIEIGYLVQT